MWPWLLLSVICFALFALVIRPFRSRAKAPLSSSAREQDQPAAANPPLPTSAKATTADPEPDGLSAQPPTTPTTEPEPESDPEPVPFIHERHWAVLGDEPDPHQLLIRIFERLLQSDSEAAALMLGEHFHLVDKRSRLMFSALVRRTRPLQLLSMFPYTESPHTWPLTLKRIEESPDGLEARLICSCHGAAVAIYDTLYLKNRDAYSLGQTLSFQVSAIAYQLEADELDSNYAEDFTGFGPLSGFSKDPNAAPDEVVVHSYIEASFDTEFWGIPLTVYVMTLAVPGEVRMRTEVYTHAAVAERRFEVGERVRGVLWLFGMYPAPTETASDEAAAGPPHTLRPPSGKKPLPN